MTECEPDVTFAGKTVIMTSRNSNLVLTAPRDCNGGEQLTQEQDVEVPLQRWLIEAVPGTKYASTIKNAQCSKLVLEVYQASVNDGAMVNLWENNGGCHQTWEILKCQDDQGTFWKIMNRHSSKLMEVVGGASLDSKKPGAKIDQWTDQGQVNQKWCIEVAD